MKRSGRTLSNQLSHKFGCACTDLEMPDEMVVKEPQCLAGLETVARTTRYWPLAASASGPSNADFRTATSASTVLD